MGDSLEKQNEVMSCTSFVALGFFAPDFVAPGFVAKAKIGSGSRIL
jgi:hypothetical protein